MPRGKALFVCTTPGCPNLTEGGRCTTCNRAANQRRGSARGKGYDARWERTKHNYLQVFPLCQCDQCTALPSVMRPWATEVHHRDGLGPRGPRGHDWSNLQSMTHAHHSRVTAIEQPGGWNDRG